MDTKFTPKIKESASSLLHPAPPGIQSNTVKPSCDNSPQHFDLGFGFIANSLVCSSFKNTENMGNEQGKPGAGPRGSNGGGRGGGRGATAAQGLKSSQGGMNALGAICVGPTQPMMTVRPDVDKGGTSVHSSTSNVPVSSQEKQTTSHPVKQTDTGQKPTLASIVASGNVLANAGEVNEVATVTKQSSQGTYTAPATRTRTQPTMGVSTLKHASGSKGVKTEQAGQCSTSVVSGSGMSYAGAVGKGIQSPGPPTSLPRQSSISSTCSMPCAASAVPTSQTGAIPKTNQSSDNVANLSSSIGSTMRRGSAGARGPLAHRWSDVIKTPPGTPKTPHAFQTIGQGSTRTSNVSLNSGSSLLGSTKSLARGTSSSSSSYAIPTVTNNNANRSVKGPPLRPFMTPQPVRRGQEAGVSSGTVGYERKVSTPGPQRQAGMPPQYMSASGLYRNPLPQPSSWADIVKKPSTPPVSPSRDTQPRFPGVNPTMQKPRMGVPMQEQMIQHQSGQQIKPPSPSPSPQMQNEPVKRSCPQNIQKQNPQTASHRQNVIGQKSNENEESERKAPQGGVNVNTSLIKQQQPVQQQQNVRHQQPSVHQQKQVAEKEKAVQQQTVQQQQSQSAQQKCIPQSHIIQKPQPVQQQSMQQHSNQSMQQKSSIQQNVQQNQPAQEQQKHKLAQQEHKQPIQQQSKQSVQQQQSAQKSDVQQKQSMQLVNQPLQQHQQQLQTIQEQQTCSAQQKQPSAQQNQSQLIQQKQQTIQQQQQQQKQPEQKQKQPVQPQQSAQQKQKQHIQQQQPIREEKQLPVQQQKQPVQPQQPAQQRHQPTQQQIQQSVQQQQKHPVQQLIQPVQPHQSVPQQKQQPVQQKPPIQQSAQQKQLPQQGTNMQQEQHKPSFQHQSTQQNQQAVQQHNNQPLQQKSPMQQHILSMQQQQSTQNQPLQPPVQQKQQPSQQKQQAAQQQQQKTVDPQQQKLAQPDQALQKQTSVQQKQNQPAEVQQQCKQQSVQQPTKTLQQQPTQPKQQQTTVQQSTQQQKRLSVQQQSQLAQQKKNPVQQPVQLQQKQQSVQQKGVQEQQTSSVQKPFQQPQKQSVQPEQKSAAPQQPSKQTVVQQQQTTKQLVVQQQSPKIVNEPQKQPSQQQKQLQQQMKQQEKENKQKSAAPQQPSKQIVVQQQQTTKQPVVQQQQTTKQPFVQQQSPKIVNEPQKQPSQQQKQVQQQIKQQEKEDKQKSVAPQQPSKQTVVQQQQTTKQPVVQQQSPKIVNEPQKQPSQQQKQVQQQIKQQEKENKQEIQQSVQMQSKSAQQQRQQQTPLVSQVNKESVEMPPQSVQQQPAENCSANQQQKQPVQNLESKQQERQLQQIQHKQEQFDQEQQKQPLQENPLKHSDVQQVSQNPENKQQNQNQNQPDQMKSLNVQHLLDQVNTPIPSQSEASHGVSMCDTDNKLLSEAKVNQASAQVPVELSYLQRRLQEEQKSLKNELESVKESSESESGLGLMVGYVDLKKARLSGEWSKAVPVSDTKVKQPAASSVKPPCETSALQSGQEVKADVSKNIPFQEGARANAKVAPGSENKISASELTGASDNAGKQLSTDHPAGLKLTMPRHVSEDGKIAMKKDGSSTPSTPGSKIHAGWDVPSSPDTEDTSSECDSSAWHSASSMVDITEQIEKEEREEKIQDNLKAVWVEPHVQTTPVSGVVNKSTNQNNTSEGISCIVSKALATDVGDKGAPPGGHKEQVKKSEQNIVKMRTPGEVREKDLQAASQGSDVNNDGAFSQTLGSQSSVGSQSVRQGAGVMPTLPSGQAKENPPKTNEDNAEHKGTMMESGAKSENKTNESAHEKNKSDVATVSEESSEALNLSATVEVKSESMGCQQQLTRSESQEQTRITGPGQSSDCVSSGAILAEGVIVTSPGIPGSSKSVDVPKVESPLCKPGSPMQIEGEQGSQTHLSDPAKPQTTEADEENMKRSQAFFTVINSDNAPYSQMHRSHLNSTEAKKKKVPTATLR